MNIFLLILFLTVIRQTIGDNKNTLCSDTNGNFEVFEALRVDDRILLIIETPNKRREYYGVKGFQYSDTYFTFDSIEKLNNLPRWFSNVFSLFTLRNDKRILESIALRYEVSIVFRYKTMNFNILYEICY